MKILALLLLAVIALVVILVIRSRRNRRKPVQVRRAKDYSTQTQVGGSLYQSSSSYTRPTTKPAPRAKKYDRDEDEDFAAGGYAVDIPTASYYEPSADVNEPSKVDTSYSEPDRSTYSAPTYEAPSYTPPSSFSSSDSGDYGSSSSSSGSSSHGSDSSSSSSSSDSSSY